MREKQTEVLIVGAGPVGLWTALRLAKAGFEATVIDRESRTAARSYACALHPRTLNMLKGMGLADEVIALGRRVDTVAFYEGSSRQSELKLSALGGDFPFLLVVPQSAFEKLLAEHLHSAGAALHWNHQFVGAVEDAHEVAASVEELAGTSTGYIVPHWETVVKDRSVLRSLFVIGADGHHSTVRQSLGIPNESMGEPELFAAFEFTTADEVANEVRVVMDEATTNVLWPLPGLKYRWTFQLSHSEAAGEFPEKDRRAVRVAEPQVDERIRQYVQKVAHRRAPWFSAAIQEITWCSEVAFERRLAAPFGRGRCWLAGDAAHQTGPVGVQSMNAGFAEGEMLTELIGKIQRNGASLDLLTTYDQAQQKRWRGLLGKTGNLRARGQTSSWASRRATRLLPCLPGLDAQLGAMAGQMALDWTETA